MDKTIGGARGRGGLDAAAIAPGAITGAFPKEASGGHLFRVRVRVRVRLGLQSSKKRQVATIWLELGLG